MTMHQDSVSTAGDATVGAGARRPFTLREFLAVAFKDKRRIAAGFLVPFLITIIVSFIPTPRYEASSTVLVRMGREFTYRPEVGEGNMQPIAFDREQALRSEVEIVSSRDLEERVIEQMGIERLYPGIANSRESATMPHKARALLEMQKRLDVLLLKDSNVIQVSFKHPDAQIAAEAVNRLVDNYLEKRRLIFSDAKVAFAESQVKSFRQRLADMETKVEQFKKTNNIVSFPEQLALLLNQRDELEIKVRTASTTVAEAAGKLESLRNNSRNATADVHLYTETNHDDALDKARKALLDLRLKEIDLTSKYTDTNALVVNARSEIQRAESYIRQLEGKPTDTVRVGRNPVRDSVEFDLMHVVVEQKAAEAGKAALVSQLAAVSAQLNNLSKQQRELDDMMRERQILDNGYQTYVKKLEEAHILDDLDRNEKTNVSVVQSALPPIQRKNLQPIILAVGLVLSCCIALVVALISELLRDTFMSPEKLERSLGFPVLTSISYMERPRKGRLALSGDGPE